MKQYTWLPTLLSILVVAAFGIFLVPAKTAADKTMLIERELAEQYGKQTKITSFSSQKVMGYEINGFTISGSDKLGFAVLEKDQRSRDELVRVVRFEKLTKCALDTYIEYIDLRSEQTESDLQTYLVVMSSNPKLASITVSVDGGEPVAYEVRSSPSLLLIKYPMGTASVEYLFYDKSGSIL